LDQVLNAVTIIVETEHAMQSNKREQERYFRDLSALQVGRNCEEI
jgi:hypothetical protein